MMYFISQPTKYNLDLTLDCFLLVGSSFPLVFGQPNRIYKCKFIENLKKKLDKKYSFIYWNNMKKGILAYIRRKLKKKKSRHAIPRTFQSHK